MVLYKKNYETSIDVEKTEVLYQNNRIFLTTMTMELIFILEHLWYYGKNYGTLEKKTYDIISQTMQL